MFAVSLVVSRSRANYPEQPRGRLEEESREVNKANEEEQRQALIASVKKRETEDDDDDSKQKGVCLHAND